jgi:hypothetical protein
LALGLAVFLAMGICGWLVVAPVYLLPGNHERALLAVRAYCSAQTIYRRKDRDGDGKLEYADSLAKLAQAELIPSGMAAARGLKGKPYRGYIFLEGKTIAGTPIDWAHDYMISAIPAKYGATGRKVFVVSTNATVFAYDMGPNPKFRVDYPANPTMDQWMMLALIDDEPEPALPGWQLKGGVALVVFALIGVPVMLLVARARSRRATVSESRAKR